MSTPEETMQTRARALEQKESLKESLPEDVRDTTSIHVYCMRTGLTKVTLRLIIEVGTETGRVGDFGSPQS